MPYNASPNKLVKKVDESGFRHHYTPTYEMMKNLEKIFRFYASLHIPMHKSHKLTFDEINHQNKIVSISEFYKFCSDFAIPLTK